MKKFIILVIINMLVLGLCSCGKSIETPNLNGNQKNTQKEVTEETTVEEIITDNIAKEEFVDYSNYFNGVNGCATIFDKQNNKYYFYNEDLCRKQVSPCSTFKIVSTLIGLNNEIITTKESTMGYDGSIYPVSEWNDELSLVNAFQTSCIWYFRHIIDEVGQSEVEKELDNLQYGNCDISEWGGSKMNPSDDLNGFWLESSLKISPFEQVKIVANIFEGNTNYSKEDISILKDIMLVDSNNDMKLYGKTGTGTDGHAWFVGYVENNAQRYYFAIYLSDNTADNISGELAKEIAIQLFSNLELLKNPLNEGK